MNYIHELYPCLLSIRVSWNITRPQISARKAENSHPETGTKRTMKRPAGDLGDHPLQRWTRICDTSIFGLTYTCMFNHTSNYVGLFELFEFKWIWYVYIIYNYTILYILYYIYNIIYIILYNILYTQYAVYDSCVFTKHGPAHGPWPHHLSRKVPFMDFMALANADAFSDGIRKRIPNHSSVYVNVFQWFNGEVLMSFSSFRDVTWCNYWKHKKNYFLIKEFWLEFQARGDSRTSPKWNFNWWLPKPNRKSMILSKCQYLLVLSMSLIIFDLRPVELWQSCQSWKPDDTAGRFDDWAARFCFDDRLANAMACKSPRSVWAQFVTWTARKLQLWSETEFS
jgi:hypothetical protein